MDDHAGGRWTKFILQIVVHDCRGIILVSSIIDINVPILLEAAHLLCLDPD